MKLVITMSRRYGTGTKQMAEILAKRLDVPVYDKVSVEEEMAKHTYSSEADVIRHLAEEPCIILGRAASEVLKHQRNAFHVYVCADKEDRVKRIMANDGLSHEEAFEMVEKTDRERSAYYHGLTGKTWGDVKNYHMILNTSDHGVEKCADILIRYFEQKELI